VGKVSGGALKDIIDEVLRENAEVIEDIKSGRDKKGKKVKFLQGLVMRRTKGQADPQEVSELLDESLKN
jgi:aspartyl-tRNA(Asn)/glutamyl-tRNA(Gln) amidotransferase subunit B